MINSFIEMEIQAVEENKSPPGASFVFPEQVESSNQATPKPKKKQNQNQNVQKLTEK